MSTGVHIAPRYLMQISQNTDGFTYRKVKLFTHVPKYKWKWREKKIVKSTHEIVKSSYPGVSWGRVQKEN